MSAAKGDQELRAGFQSSARRLAVFLGKMRDAAGPSTVVLLCASALAPLASAGVVVDPATVIALGIAGNVGAEVLADVTMQKIESMRRTKRTNPGEHELSGGLSTMLPDEDDTATSLREAVSSLLQEVRTTRTIVEYSVAADALSYTMVADGLAELGQRFEDFAFVYDAVHESITTLQAMLANQCASRCLSTQPRTTRLHPPSEPTEDGPR